MASSARGIITRILSRCGDFACTYFASSNFGAFFSLGDPSVPVSRSPRGFSFPHPLQDKHVISPISFCSACPPDRSRIVIFDLPDQPFNIHSKEAGSPMRPSLLRPPSPVVLLSLISSLAPDRIVPFVHYLLFIVTTN
jgi:hypothetical protein